MSAFALKQYQQTSLDTLREYLAAVSDMGPKKAFIYLTDRAYHSVEQLPGLPYVCVRIPTGGGKTVVASHAVGIAAQEVQRQEHCVVLWLVPTNTIKEQTLAALKERSHPYRQALESGVGPHVAVMDLAAALHVQRAVLDSDTVVIVSTLAALRVEDTDGRKVYEQNGSLMSHFDGCPQAVLDTLEKYEGSDKPVQSLANVLRMRHPVVIVDEAHNARTQLSFDTLARFEPACILEFTATPARPPSPNPSNVLCHVSAYELKTEDMIKLPIRLQADANWKDAVSATVARRAELEAAANAERIQTGEYIRPIALLQAQPRNQTKETLTVDVLRTALADLGVPGDQIAIETGQVGEVGDWEQANKASVFDEKCPIRFIATVDKLREGWDCPFAYVLCSVRDMGAKTAVEQILGRVLRMPKAIRKQQDDLNYAYAYVTSSRFSDAVNGLTDSLVANGFTRFEASDGVEHQTGKLDFSEGLFEEPTSVHQSPAQRGERFAVPQLAFWSDGELDPVDETHFLQMPWELSKCPATLSEQEFPTKAAAWEQYDVDVNKQGDASIRQTEVGFVSDLQMRLALLMPNDITRPEQMAVWLDKQIKHPDIVQTQSIVFLLSLVDGLINQRGIPLDVLARERLRLRDAAARKIAEYRRAVVKTAYQQILFGDLAAQVEVSAKRVFTYDPMRYPANSLYEGPYQFKKHYYHAVGAMNSEEAGCAQLIDSLPQVKYWVRNLERRADISFWLQTSTDKFYPDFVALLEDGRVLAVEYKGDMLKDTPDTAEKRALGGLWAAKSNGACVFLLVGHDDYAAQLKRAAE